MQQEETVDLRPFFAFTWSKKWPVLGWGALLSVVLLGLTLVFPPVWRASTVLLLPLPDPLNPLPTPTPGLGSSADPLAIVQGMIQSYPAQKYVSEKTGLTVLDVQNKVAVSTNTANQQVMVTFDDTRKEFGLKVIQSVLEALDERSGKTDVSRAAAQARFYQQAVDERKKTLEAAEEAVLHFQKTSMTAPDPSNPFSGSIYQKSLLDTSYQIQSVTKQIEVAKNLANQQGSSASEIPTALQANGKWRDKLVALEYELQVARTQFGDSAPQVVAKEREIDVTKKAYQREVANELTSINQQLDPEVAQLEAKRLLLESQKAYYIKMSAVAPDEAVRLQRLVREALGQADLYKDVRTRLESAKVQAEVEKSKWSVLAEPYIQPQPTNKAYVRNTLLGLFLGMLAAATFYYRRYAAAERKKVSGRVAA